MADSDPIKLVRRLSDETPLSTESIRAGRNSRVFRVDCESGKSLLVKFYLQPTADGGSRLEQEWTALNFMSESGIKNIPAPLEFDDSLQGAIFTFIQGNPVQKHTDQDMDEIISFLGKLKEISRQKKAQTLDRAAEACFSPAELVDNIRQRYARLQTLPSADPVYRRMHSFLNERFSPEFEKSINSAQRFFPGRSWHEPLDKNVRTLSPSDFGFHNALRTETGLTFVDFEYFGWDDPVKATSHFLLHPAMKLSEQQMLTFFAGMKNIFADDKNFIQRFKIYLPLFRLKWCMILLNEFMSSHLERRVFAAGETMDKDLLRREQLEKAENFLNKDKKILAAINFQD